MWKCVSAVSLICTHIVCFSNLIWLFFRDVIFLPRSRVSLWITTISPPPGIASCRVCKFKKFPPEDLFFVSTVEKFQILEYEKVAMLNLWTLDFKITFGQKMTFPPPKNSILVSKDQKFCVLKFLHFHFCNIKEYGSISSIPAETYWICLLYHQWKMFHQPDTTKLLQECINSEAPSTFPVKCATGHC